MKHFFAAFIGLYVLPSPGAKAPEAKESDLPIQTIAILCESEAEPSLCEPLAMLKEAKAQWDQALKAGEAERNSLNEQLEISYVSKVDPYVADVCANNDLQKHLEQSNPDVPAYMKPLCDSWLILRATEAELSEMKVTYLQTLRQQASLPYTLRLKAQVLRDVLPDSFLVPQIIKEVVEETALQLQQAEIDYQEKRQMTMEVTCDGGLPPLASQFPEFCELWGRFQEHKRTDHQSAKASAKMDLEDAKYNMKYAIATICESDEKFRQGKYYMEVLCRTKYSDEYI